MSDTVCIPVDAIRDPFIGPTDFRCLCELVSRADDDGRLSISMRELAGELGRHHSAVWQHVAALRRAGWVEVDAPSDHSIPYSYRLLRPRVEVA